MDRFKEKILTGAICIFHVFSAYSQNMKLNGPVSLERTQRFIPKYEFGELKNGEPNKARLNLYNADQKLLYSFFYQKEGERQYVSRLYYFYNSKGDVAKELWIGNYNEDDGDYAEMGDDAFYRYVSHNCQYDNKGRLTIDNLYSRSFDNNDSTFYGRNISSYGTGKRITKYYDSNGVETDREQINGMDIAINENDTKSETNLGITYSVSNVKRDANKNITSCVMKIDGWGAEYKADVKVSYKYDSHKNCVSWLKTTTVDARFIVDIQKGVKELESMQKDVLYSTKDAEYVELLNDAYEWLINKTYCPSEVLDIFDDDKSKNIRGLYDKQDYMGVINNWCDTCKSFNVGAMKKVYVLSVMSEASNRAEKGDYAKAIELTNMLMANESFDNYYDKMDLTTYLAEYQCAQKFTSADALFKQQKYKEALDEINYLYTNKIFTRKYNSHTIEDKMVSYKESYVESLIDQQKYQEGLQELNSLKNSKYGYKSSKISSLTKTCNAGLEKQYFDKAQSLFNNGSYLESYETISALRKEKTYTRRNYAEEQNLQDNCVNKIREHSDNVMDQAKKLIGEGKIATAENELKDIEKFKDFMTTGDKTKYKSLREECRLKLLCEEADGLLEKAELAKKKKDWQNVANTLKPINENYSHCKCYISIQKLKEKAESKDK